MAKHDEVHYIDKVAEVENVPIGSFTNYLAHKPFSDPRCGEYLMDIAQIMRVLPPPPARLLDVGVGSGWTSELFARKGYEVLGVDISPDMINLAKQRALPNLSFGVCDYESMKLPKGFDIAVIYDALHHADDEYRVIQNIFSSLGSGGVLVTVEPGAGHSTSEDSVEVMRKYGTTEKDMPFARQRELMENAGFKRIEQYCRLSQLPTADVSTLDGAVGQVRHALALTHGSATGLTSVVVAFKSGAIEIRSEAVNVADALSTLSVTSNEQNDILAGMLHEAEADRTARGKQIETLTAMVHEAEADRTARGKQIETLTAMVHEVEANRANVAKNLSDVLNDLEALKRQRSFRLLARVARWNRLNILNDQLIRFDR